MLTCIVKGNYILKVYEYPQIAQHIVDSRVDIPIKVMVLLKRCIDLRIKCLNPLGTEPDDSTNTHMFFINTLHRVAFIFTQYMTSLRSDSSSATGPSKQTASWSSANPFNPLAEAALSSEDDHEDDEDIPLGPPPRPDRLIVRVEGVSADVEMSINEAIFSLVAFLRDVTAVRNYLAELWVSYRARQIDLMTAAITTNTALELLRRPHDDILANVMPAFDDDITRSAFYLLHIHSQNASTFKGGPIRNFTDIDESDKVLTSCYDCLLLPNLLTMLDLGQTITNGLPARYDGVRHGWYDPMWGNKPKASFHDRHRQGSALLMETFSRYLCALQFCKWITNEPEPLGKDVPGDLKQIWLGMGVSEDAYDKYCKEHSGPEDIDPRREDQNPLSADEMAVEMATFSKTGRPTWLLLAHTAIYIDINYYMKAHVGQGEKDMFDQYSKMASAINNARTIIMDNGLERKLWSPYENYWLDMTVEVVDGPGIEFLSLIMGVHPGDVLREDRQPGDPLPENQFYKRSPMHCGISLFQQRLHHQKCAFNIVNASGIIMATAHFYAAMRLYQSKYKGPVVADWAEMDILLDLHGRADIFGGRTPETLDEALDTFIEVNALPADIRETMEKALRRLKFIAPTTVSVKSQRASLRDHSKIVPIFHQRYCIGTTMGTRLDIDTIQALHVDIRAGKRDSASGRVILPKKLRRERTKKGSQFTVVQSLAIIEAGLEMEPASIRFDYFGLHMKCIQLWRSVGAKDGIRLDNWRRDAEFAVPPVVAIQTAVMSVKSRDDGKKATLHDRKMKAFYASRMKRTIDVLNSLIADLEKGKETTHSASSR